MQNPQNPNPTPAATGPTSTPATSQPTHPRPNNLQPQPQPQPQSQPVRPPAQSQPQPSAQQINRPLSQNQGGPTAQSTASSTSGLLDRTGDKARSGSAGGSMSGGNMQGSTNGPGSGPGQVMSGGGGNGRPGPGTGGLGHPNRPTNITIPSAFPAIPNPNGNGQGPHHPPNSALNTPAGSTANTPTGTSTVGGPNSNSNSNFTRTNNNNNNASSSSNSSYQPTHPTRMIGQNDRSVVGQGRLFAEPLAKEIARTQIERAGGRPKVNNNNNNNNSNQNHGNSYGYDVKGMVMADRAVEGMLASMMRSANRIKEHRVAYTNPRVPPFWPSTSTASGSTDAGAKVGVKKETGGPDEMDVDTNEAGEAKQEVPMWKIEVLDDPRKEIYAAHASIEESEKAKKSARVKERIEYDQRKRDEAEGRILGMGMEVDETKGEGEGMQVDGDAGGSAVGTSSGPSTPGPGAGAGPSTPGLVAPDSMSTPSNKKKPTKRNPQAEQDLAARRADEAMRKESSRAISSIKGMGTKKYSWMNGGGVGASPRTPLSKLGVGGLGSGGKNRRTSMLVDGKIKIDSGGSGASSPSTPGPAGMRGNKRPFDGTPLSMSKRTKKGSGLMNEMTLETAPSKPNPYEFVKVDDKLGMNDVMTAFRREVVRGGPNRAMYEKKYFEIMVLMAEAAHEEWKKDNAGLGGSTIAGGSSLALD